MNNIVIGIDEFNSKSGRSSLGGPGSLVLDKGEHEMFDAFIKSRRVVWHLIFTHILYLI